MIEPVPRRLRRNLEQRRPGLIRRVIAADPRNGLDRWLHRHGVARMLNGPNSNNYNLNSTALIETFGPPWLTQRLWRRALAYSVRSEIGPRVIWSTVRAARELGPPSRCWRQRWRVAYLRQPDFPVWRP